MQSSSDNDRSRGSRAPWHWPMWAQVLVAMVVGITLGCLSGLLGPGPEMSVYQLLGTLFLNALKMLIVPLVAFSIISAIAGLGRMDGMARLGGKTIGFYAVTSLVAILIGLTLVNLIAPGAHVGITADQAAELVAVEGSAEAAKLAEFQEKTQGAGLHQILDVVLGIIPPNIIEAAWKGQMLGIIFFSLLFAFFILKLPERLRLPFTLTVESIYEVLMLMTMFVLRFLPIGVCFLIAGTMAEAIADEKVATYGKALAWFALTALLALSLHAVVVLPLIVRLVGRVSPWRHAQAMGPALITAFSTASSSATLPMTMECVRHRAGVSRRVTGFVLPVGATVNMDGTALYECVAVMFLAQLAGIDLGFAQQFLIVFLALLTSIGVAGIPSASLIAIAIILNSVNAQLPEGGKIPEASLALIFIIDRLLDMCRTTVNIWGDSCCAVTIARSEGETDVLVEPPPPTHDVAAAA